MSKSPEDVHARFDSLDPVANVLAEIAAQLAEMNERNQHKTRRRTSEKKQKSSTGRKNGK